MTAPAAGRLPDFVMIGPPKCSTSSVFRWLAAHPDACGSAVKETHYLLDAGHPMPRRGDVHQGGLEGYAALFAHCGGTRVAFEASTHYVFADTARTVLASLPSQPFVLAILREPARRLYSSFRYTQGTRADIDAGVTFRAMITAIRAGDAAFLHRVCHNASSRYVLARELLYSDYARWLAPWYEALGRDRVWTALFEDVVADPRAFITGLAARLGLDPGFYATYPFDAYNPTVRARAPMLHRLALRSAWIPGLGPLKRAYKAFMIDREARTPSADDRAVIAEVAREFAPLRPALGALTGLDLSPWAAADAR